MRYKKYVLAASLVMLSSSVYAEGARVAQAKMIDSMGKKIGIATLVENGKGGVQISLNAHGLTPGLHGMHVHSVGHCVTSTFVSAGAHFNPGGTQHGMENPLGPHAGDLPNLEVKPNGNAATNIENEYVTLELGMVNSLLDANGSAIIIHQNPDDNITNPTGNSGRRVACGVIESLGN